MKLEVFPGHENDWSGWGLLQKRVPCKQEDGLTGAEEAGGDRWKNAEMENGERESDVA